MCVRERETETETERDRESSSSSGDSNTFIVHLANIHHCTTRHLFTFTFTITATNTTTVATSSTTDTEKCHFFAISSLRRELSLTGTLKLP